MRILIFFLLFLSLEIFGSPFSERLNKVISKDPPTWMLKQLEEDFTPYQEKGIRLESLDHLMEVTQGEMTARFKIQGGKVFVYPDPQDLHKGRPSDRNFFNARFKSFLDAVHKLADAVVLPDVEFVVTVNDCGDFREDITLAPLLVYSKRKNFVTHVLIPDGEALHGYDHFNREIEKGCKQFPWEKKLNKAFWRGATSDGCYDLEHWEENPRAKLVLLSLQFPQLIDASFHIFVSGAENNPAMLANPLLKSNFLSPRISLKYKYLVDVDGTTCSWQRCYWTLLSNSLVFKQTSDNIEWFYKALIPHYHFIPIENSISDLPEKILQAMNDDQKMKKIAQNATEFVKTNLSEEMIYLYFYLVIKKYAELEY